MKGQTLFAASRATSLQNHHKFRMPTKDNLVPIRLNIDHDGHRFTDAFTWDPTDPDAEVTNFAKRIVKDLKLPPSFVTQISQSIQAQLGEFRSYEGQDMYIREKIVTLKVDLRVNSTIIRDHFLWDISNFESEPEEFARTLCSDLDIEDPEFAPAIAVSIREQLYEIATQSVTAIREAKLGKKSRRAPEFSLNSKAGNNALDLYKYFGSKGSVIRKRKEWHLYEPIVDVLSSEQTSALNAKEEQNARMRRKMEERDEMYQSR